MFDTNLQGERSHSEQVLRNRRPRFQNQLSSEDSLLRSSDLPGLLLRAGLCTKDTGNETLALPSRASRARQEREVPTQRAQQSPWDVQKVCEVSKDDAQMVTDRNTRKRARNVSVWDFDSRIFPLLEAVLFGQARALPCGTSDKLTGSCLGHRKLWWPQAPGSVDKCPTGPHRNKRVCDQVRKDQTLAALGKEKPHVQHLSSITFSSTLKKKIQTDSAISRKILKVAPATFSVLCWQCRISAHF